MQFSTLSKNQGILTTIIGFRQTVFFNMRYLSYYTGFVLEAGDRVKRGLKIGLTGISGVIILAGLKTQIYGDKDEQGENFRSLLVSIPTSFLPSTIGTPET